MSQSHEHAWCAGFFDGEGHTSFARHKTGGTLRLVVSQVNRRRLERFRDAVGLGKIYGPYGAASHHSLQIWKADEVDAAMRKMWPYLDEDKIVQYIAARFKWQTRKVKDRI